jgi:hypothetical protein
VNSKESLTGFASFKQTSRHWKAPREKGDTGCFDGPLNECRERFCLHPGLQDREKARLGNEKAVSGIALSSCGGESFYFPEGDAEAGKQVFTELKCYACHEVVGEDFPDPSAITPTFVALGATGEQKPRLYLVESIIAPSHQFAQPRPPAGQTSSEQNIRAGTRSRMSDYSEQLTVRELCDLVSYLEAIQGTGGTQVGSF